MKNSLPLFKPAAGMFISFTIFIISCASFPSVLLLTHSLPGLAGTIFMWVYLFLNNSVLCLSFGFCLSRPAAALLRTCFKLLLLYVFPPLLLASSLFAVCFIFVFDVYMCYLFCYSFTLRCCSLVLFASFPSKAELCICSICIEVLIFLLLHPIHSSLSLSFVSLSTCERSFSPCASLLLFRLSLKAITAHNFTNSKLLPAHNTKVYIYVCSGILISEFIARNFFPFPSSVSFRLLIQFIALYHASS